MNKFSIPHSKSVNIFLPPQSNDQKRVFTCLSYKLTKQNTINSQKARNVMRQSCGLLSNHYFVVVTSNPIKQKHQIIYNCPMYNILILLHLQFLILNTITPGTTCHLEREDALLRMRFLSAAAAARSCNHRHLTCLSRIEKATLLTASLYNIINSVSCN